jgi:hypothetical protein
MENNALPACTTANIQHSAQATADAQQGRFPAHLTHKGLQHRIIYSGYCGVGIF